MNAWCNRVYLAVMLVLVNLGAMASDRATPEMYAHLEEITRLIGDVERISTNCGNENMYLYLRADFVEQTSRFNVFSGQHITDLIDIGAFEARREYKNKCDPHILNVKYYDLNAKISLFKLQLVVHTEFGTK